MRTEQRETNHRPVTLGRLVCDSCRSDANIYVDKHGSFCAECGPGSGLTYSNLKVREGAR